MKRQRKGSGCVYRPEFKTKDGKVRFGGWRIKYTWNRETYNEKVNARNKREAEEFLKQRFAQILSGTFVKGSEAESLGYEEMRGYLFRDRERRELKSLKTKKGGERTISNLKHVDEFFGGRRALDIDARLVDEFVVGQQRAGAANGTINRALGLLRRMFRLAVDQKKLREDQVPKFVMLKEARPRSGFLEPEDFPRLRRALPDDLRAIATLAYYTGMRKGEIRFLLWENVDLLEGVLRLTDTKNGTPRNVRLNAETAEMLRIERARHPDCPWVFSRDGRGPIGNFEKTWKKACIRAGLGRRACRACSGELDAKLCCKKCGQRHSRATAGYVGLLFHDLRRSGVRNYVRSGVPESVAMKISGHRTRAVFERYNITSDRDMEEASRRMTEYVSDTISKRLVKAEAETPGESGEQKTVVQ